MRFTILDGAAAPGAFAAYVDALAASLRARGADVARLAGRELTLAQCRGCFGCWTRTPGRCVIRDDGERILREVAAADVMVIASPVEMGLTTALTRRMTERLLPLLHPHFEVVEGEVHHRQRYARRARLALLHGADGVDAEDEEILAVLHRRMALNYGTTLALVASTARGPEEVADALARL